jgi:hypothetical protein
VFPSRAESECDRSTPYLSAFSCGRNIHFVKNSPVQVNCRITCTSWKTQSMWEAVLSYKCFPYENLVSLERNSSSLSVFSSGRNIHFMKNSTTPLNWRNTCISWSNTICVWSRHVLYFPLTTELACEKNVPYLPVFSSVRNIHFMKNGPLQTNWRNKRNFWKSIICVRGNRVFHIFSLWELN